MIHTWMHAQIQCLLPSPIPSPPPRPQSKAQAEKADLMNRLNNAVAQRNAAREEALMLEAKLKQLQVGGAQAHAGGGRASPRLGVMPV